MDSTGPRNIVAIDMHKSQKTPMERLLRKSNKSNKSLSRTETTRHKVQWLMQKLRPQYQRALLGLMPPRASAMQATRGDTQVGRTKETCEREGFSLQERAAFIPELRQAEATPLCLPTNLTANCVHKQSKKSVRFDKLS